MTQAMILAAGEGRRMRPLTLTTPKPLLKVGGRTLIEHQLDRLRAAGVEDCIINIAYLGEQIREHLGNGERYGLHVRYSAEPYPLETGGAIAHALPLLKDAPFLLLNADVWLDYPLSQLLARVPDVEDGHLVLVDNPDHNRNGDFALAPTGAIVAGPGSAPASVPAGHDMVPRYTFSGLSLLHPRMIRDYPERRQVFPLREALEASIARHKLSGEYYRGTWWDVGTPERLHDLDASLEQP